MPEFQPVCLSTDRVALSVAGCLSLRRVFNRMRRRERGGERVGKEGEKGGSGGEGEREKKKKE